MPETIGQRLKKAREYRNLTLEKVEAGYAYPFAIFAGSGSRRFFRHAFSRAGARVFA